MQILFKTLLLDFIPAMAEGNYHEGSKKSRHSPREHYLEFAIMFVIYDALLPP